MIEVQSRTSCEDLIKEKDKEIEKLNKKIEQYENPEDMTLMFMWCDEKAKDEIKRLNNIINGMEKFFKYAYDNEVKPLNDRKVSVWTICLDKLQELKGSDK